MQDVTAGFVVGKGVVAGARCDHLAFRKPDVDWQIWMREGPRPLPCKFVITSKRVAGMPSFSVVMTGWNTAPKLAGGTFTFAPPKDAKRIEFLPPAAAGTK